MTQDAVAELLRNVQADIKSAREDVEKNDKARTDAFDELKVEVAKGSKSVTDVEAKLARIVDDQVKSVAKLQSIEQAVNELMKQAQRPGGFVEDKSKAERRQKAIDLLEYKHKMNIVKQSALQEMPFNPTEDEIAVAEIAIKAMRALMHTTHIDNLPAEYRKALSAFTFGSQGFILAPELSNEILSCLVDEADITGLMRNITISGPSIKFMVDNEVWDVAAWACESSCFANNPTQQIGSGLGELEIKPESLRYIVCATRDLLDDASVNIEQWMLQKVNRAFRMQVNNAVLTGDGFGKPMGILNPAAGIPVVETALGSAPGQFTWQDLVMLRWQVPMSLAATGGGVSGGGAYLMNQNTLGLVLTLSDTAGRPIMVQSPVEGGQMLISGTQVVIANQMPDVAPGSLPVAYGNWNLVYMVVNRKAVTMQQDPYSAGFCVLYKFESRIGGGVVCPNAARLLRIR